MKRLGQGFLRIIPAFVTAALFAQEIPLVNWTVPPYNLNSAGGIHTMVDQTPPRAFVGLPPCRLLDTRPPVNNPLDGDGAFAIDETRPYVLPGACGIPAEADAVSLNVTATNTGAQAFGHIKVWPVGQTEPNVSTLNYPGPGATVANAAIVPLGTGGAINVKSGNAGADVIMDVNGYFSDVPASPNSFVVSSAVGGGAAIAGSNSAAVADSAGVTGSATGAARTYGVLGIKPGNSNGAAGVKGVQGAAVASAPNQAPAGVVGTSSLFDGILGITIAGSGGAGVKGVRTSGAAGILSSGELGVASLGGNFVNDVDIDGDLTVACIGAFGAFGCDLVANSGSKMFVEPHPSDASKVIKYVSLEGPESGTYFRGRGHFQNGIARITVPENFRFVTSPDGLTVQITPIGGMATVGVLRMNLDEIVVQSSRNLEFSYLVQGVRRAFAGHRPIQDAGIEYVRRGATSRLHERFPAELRRRLIANRTYNPDGTVNMETARRLGWDRLWAEREERPAPEPAPQ